MRSSGSCGKHGVRRFCIHAVRAALVSISIHQLPASAAAQIQTQQRHVAEPSPSVACDPRAGPLLPGQARCLAHDGDDGDAAWLYVPRLLLAPIRLAVRTISEVLIAGARIEDDYRIRSRARDLFFTEDLVFGVYPVAFYATGFGLNAGAHLVHRDLFGHREGLRVRAGFGGVHQQLYDARVHTGQLWPGVRLAAEGGYRRHGSLKFYGIGNGEEIGAGELQQPLDAFAAGPAVRTRYRQAQIRAGASAQFVVAENATVALEHVWRRFSSSVGSAQEPGTPWLTEVYDPDSLTGFAPDLTDAYTELALVYDSLRSTRPDVPADLPSRGVRLETWGAVQTAPGQPQLTSGRAGIDLHPVIDLYRADRVLHLRLRGVTALAPLDAIPFFDLPSLGGSQFLRGYEHGRFRGRLALLATVEYRYPVQEGMAAYLFGDAGRVYASWQELSPQPLRDLRFGFGGGLQIYGRRGATLLLQLASSIDGGLFVDLLFNTTLEGGTRH